ncbi:hypothetical protein [Saccharothrix xinjiangensis]|uniref:Uncharacterized protein n=1 Tax=Saccharothrix xinjiangensis TaxID=204798 RepID=A0ABV9Y9I1_9PSEU
MPDETVLAGVSMGASVVSDLWPERPAAGVLLLHATADLPDHDPAAAGLTWSRVPDFLGRLRRR